MFSKKDVFDYISGNYIQNIEELETNPVFMAEVVSIDKKSISLCSNNILKDPIFIKKIITKYKDDIDFILPIVLSYFNYEHDYIDDAEIAIMMSRITKDYYDLIENPFELKATAFYLLEQINFSVETDCDIFDKNFYNFDYYLDNYSSKTILNYVADRYISDIVYFCHYEEIVHNKYNSYDDFKEAGEINFLTKFLSSINNSLSSYTITNYNDLCSVRDILNSIKKNWNYYNICSKYQKEEIIDEKCEIILKKVDDYCFDNDLYFNIYPALVYLSKKYRIDDHMLNKIYFDNILTKLPNYKKAGISRLSLLKSIDFDIKENNDFSMMKSIIEFDNIFKKVLDKNYDPYVDEEEKVKLKKRL